MKMAENIQYHAFPFQVGLAELIDKFFLVKAHHLFLKKADTHSPSQAKSYQPRTVKQ